MKWMKIIEGKLIMQQSTKTPLNDELIAQKYSIHIAESRTEHLQRTYSMVYIFIFLYYYSEEYQ
jgi:hypothetical protein